MNTTHRHYIACDLGAESGRVLLGSLGEGRLAIEEIHRFANGPMEVGGTLRWDLPRMFAELKAGLRQAAARGIRVDSVSCDSWGVDYVLLDRQKAMVDAPYHYRDARTDGALERAFAVVPAEEIFAETGIQFMPLNTLYQLLAEKQQRPGMLAAAEKFLNVGDYFNFALSGQCKGEASLASTTQLYNPRRRAWSASLIEKFGLPGHLFAEVVPSGTVLGPLLASVAAETGLQRTQVIAGCSHDTAAAVAAVPASGDGWAYLSSGTWSLLGIESSQPIISAKSREHNFTNEVGFGGRIRFLKNIVGLWIVQECRRAWAAEGREFGYEELTEMAEQAAPLRSLLDVTDARFLKPGGMPEKIAEFFRETQQAVPTAPGEYVRCVLESLALLYRDTLDQFEEVTGQSLRTLHVVGGGSKNHLHNQMTANATGRRVLAGPSECTGIGNLLVQAIALGHVRSLEDGRHIVRESFPPARYEPQEAAAWEEARGRFRELLSRSCASQGTAFRESRKTG
jgi:rhamnulokinase